MRSAVDRASVRRNFVKKKKYRSLWRNFLADPFADLFAFHFSLWGCFKRRVFLACSAGLYTLKLRIYEVRNGVSPVISA